MSNQRRALGDVFEMVSKKIKHEDKIKVLHEHASQPLFYVLRIAYNDIQWALPAGAPPYREYKGRKNSGPSDLMRECKRLYMFFAGLEANMPRLRREKLFQDILESLEPGEVAVLLAMKERTLEKQFKLPRKVVEAAFPGLLNPPFDLKFGHKPVGPIAMMPGPLWDTR